MKSIRVEVVAAWPARAECVALTLPAGSTVADALAAAGIPARGKVGIFGRVVRPDAPLAQGDRVEIYRDLAEDPKEARRRRARRR
jgi:putative ubiquitin-RnfH superfamily antitoxin RatB of RatAB toxin-antitoxin module